MTGPRAVPLHASRPVHTNHHWSCSVPPQAGLWQVHLPDSPCVCCPYMDVLRPSGSHPQVSSYIWYIDVHVSLVFSHMLYYITFTCNFDVFTVSLSVCLSSVCDVHALWLNVRILSQLFCIFFSLSIWRFLKYWKSLLNSILPRVLRGRGLWNIIVLPSCY